MIYGAYGYTGELMVREAIKQGIKPIIAGRSAEKLKPLASELNLEHKAFDVREAGNYLQDISVLLNCAGPFSATAESLVRACPDRLSGSYAEREIACCCTARLGFFLRYESEHRHGEKPRSRVSAKEV